MQKNMSGMYAALMSAMDDAGNPDPVRQRDLTAYVLRQRLRGLYVGGSSGESGLLESAALLDHHAVVADCARGTGHTLIAHVGLPALADSIKLAKNAEALGYDALSALPPHAYPFSDDEIFGYYQALAAATDLPLLVYEIPVRTGRPLPFDLLLRLLDLPQVMGIKFSSDDLFKLSRLRRHRPGKLFYFGSDETFLGAAAIGVDGGIGSTYNVLGKLYVALSEAVADRDLARAQDLQRLSQEFVEILLETGIYPGMKAALRIIGVDCGVTRPPMAARVEDVEARVRPFITRADVQPWLAI